MATEKCTKCSAACYLNEKIRSSKAQTYHKACFRCVNCNTSLAFGKDHVGPDLELRCKPCFEVKYGRNGSVITQTVTATHRPSEAPSVAAEAFTSNLEEDLKEIRDFMDKKKWLRAADLISILPSTTALLGQGFLVTAAMNGASVDVFEACLDFGSEVDELDGTFTALFCSVGRRNLEAIQLLLTRGAKVNLLDKYNRSPFWVGCKNQATVEIAKLLVNFGADVNQADVDGKTPLMISVMTNQPVEYVEWLLTNAALDVNARDRDGLNCLFSAHATTPQVLELLLRKGVDCNALGKRGESVLLAFCANNASLAHVQLLFQHGFAKLEQRDQVGRSALLVASDTCSVEVVELLLAKGAGAGEVDSLGRNALYHAAHANQDLPVIKLLIETGKLDPQASGFSQHESLLQLYQQRDNKSVVEYLTSLQ